jgi:hypothetical protein
MPLSETNKAQSQSIEDLIAQLDAPVQANNARQLTSNSSNNGNSNQSIENDDSSKGSGRRLLRGKRSNSTGLNSPSQQTGSGSSASTSVTSFGKTNSFGQNSERVLNKNIIMSKKYTKHMRSLKDRGQPKKGGGGGKHTWGAPGCELAEDYLDSKDPNYDSDDGNVVMVCVENSDGGSGSGTGLKNKKKSSSAAYNVDNVDDDDITNENLKELELEDLESEIKLVILEYFQNGDTIEVIDHLKCYNFNKIKAQLICYLLQIALENNNTCKELISRLLRDLTIELFNEKDFILGFDHLLRNLPDLTLDNPDAPEVTY